MNISQINLYCNRFNDKTEGQKQFICPLKDATRRWRERKNFYFLFLFFLADEMMSVLVIQHVEDESIGYIEDIFTDFGIGFKVIRMFEREDIPNTDESDALIVLGGPMNVYEEDRYPYLIRLNDAIFKFVCEDKPYLGFCLGAQLLAKALDTPVRKSKKREIGNFEVNLTEAGREDRLFSGFDETFPVFQWHEDTFDIPEGAIKLAESKLCSNQAFRFKNAYGVQFHLEVTPKMLKRWMDDYEYELNNERIDPSNMISKFIEHVEVYKELLQQMLSNFFSIKIE